MTAYAVGDIQGCYDELRRLLDKIGFDEDKDKLWVAGDLVNRGPGSLATLRYLKSLGKNCKSVLGNHDLHLLAVAAGARKTKRSDTIQDILHAPDSKELLDWLRQQPFARYSKKHNCLMVHAGVAPQWTLAQILRYSQELQTAIQGEDGDEFFFHMYGDQPDNWSDDLKGMARLRVIANYFTRMRFCSASGALEFHSKGNNAPEGFSPWYLHEHARPEGMRVIFGHWAALEGQVEKDGYEALDTGCVWGGRLTAIRLKNGKRYSVSGSR